MFPVPNNWLLSLLSFALMAGVYSDVLESIVIVVLNTNTLTYVKPMAFAMPL